MSEGWKLSARPDVCGGLLLVVRRRLLFGCVAASSSVCADASSLGCADASSVGCAGACCAGEVPEQEKRVSAAGGRTLTP